MFGCAVRGVNEGGSGTETQTETSSAEDETTTTPWEATTGTEETTGESGECFEYLLFEGTFDPDAPDPCLVDIEPPLQQVPYVQVFMFGDQIPFVGLDLGDCTVDEGWRWQEGTNWTQVVLCGPSCELFAGGEPIEILASCPGEPSTTTG